MPAFFDLPEAVLKIGLYVDLPSVPESSACAYWAKDTRQLFICDMNMTWRDVGLYRYTHIDVPTVVPDKVQITWSEAVTVIDSGAIQIEDTGAIYVMG